MTAPSSSIDIEFADVASTEMDAVYRYMLHVTRNPTLAEDLTSATFERAFTQWHRFDPAKGTARSWLIAIGRHIAQDTARAGERRRQREQRAAPTEAHDGGMDAVGGLPSDMREALLALSDIEREVVALRVILDFSTADAASVLGIGRSAVSTHLHRALGRLRKELPGTGVQQ